MLRRNPRRKVGLQAVLPRKAGCRDVAARAGQSSCQKEYATQRRFVKTDYVCWLILQRIGEVRRTGKRIGEELVVGQSMLSDEIAPGWLDHHRRATGINLMRTQVWQIGNDSMMNQAKAAPPLVLKGRVGS